MLNPENNASRNFVSAELKEWVPGCLSPTSRYDELPRTLFDLDHRLLRPTLSG